jgi:hypothetical protein
VSCHQLLCDGHIVRVCAHTGVSGHAATPNWVSPTAPPDSCASDPRALEAAVNRSTAATAIAAIAGAGAEASGSTADAHVAGGQGDGNGGSQCGLGAKLGGTVATIDILNATTDAGAQPMNISWWVTHRTPLLLLLTFIHLFMAQSSCLPTIHVCMYLYLPIQSFRTAVTWSTMSG